MANLLLDLSHTSHTRARTGVQRVARALHRALAGKATAICLDPFEDAWRPLEDWEEANLAAARPSSGRGERWPLAARVRGRLRRWSDRTTPISESPAAPAGGPAGVIVPEIFSPQVAAALPRLFAAATGPHVALFHDAIALQYPEYAPRSTLARFPGYLRELLAFDGIAANSEASRDSLIGYWRWLGVTKAPPVIFIPLGLDAPVPGSGTAPVDPIPTVLCVGSIEGRKNHLALLDACETLWARGVHFRLRLVGLANAETGGPALDRLKRLQAAGRPVLYDGPQGDEALEAAYRDCAFTAYPSLAEGFGLPVAESLIRGKPCVCRTEGALGEIARGGGCLTAGNAGPVELAEAIGRLVESPAELAALTAAARGRRFEDWDHYARQLVDWMGSLR
jgi:glycosyltransferase involved in cell wall biosynthesis